MNPARKNSRVTQSNPRSVLQGIGSSGGFDLNQSSFEDSAAPESGDLAISNPAERHSATDLIATNNVFSTAETNSTLELVPELEGDLQLDVVSLRINPDTSSMEQNAAESVLESTIESTSQIQQLAARLEANEIELQQRESQLEQRIKAWNQDASRRQADLEKRIQEVEQQASQVRCQQLHVMQLQNDIVKSHEATRVAIESLVLETGSDERTIATLKALKYELSGRFDYITRRWEHLAELMQKSNAKIAGNKAVDDSVDWAGELS